MARDDDDDYDDRPARRRPRPSSSDNDGNLSVVEWLVCIFCSGIGCIIGIVYLVQGNPKGGKMLAISLICAVIGGVIRFALSGALQNAR
jgi:hypothetical protein